MVDVLLGLQWGDEGKGKMIDFLAPNYDIVARFQGGANAGHTIMFNGRRFVLHQLPSGIFREGVLNVIGNGVVFDPVLFFQEVASVNAHVSDLGTRLFISNKAHLVVPTHKLLDAFNEQALGTTKIGSTLKGISPAYQSKVSRKGLRIGDILTPTFVEKTAKLVNEHCAIMGIDFPTESVGVFLEYCHQLQRDFLIVDTEVMLNGMLRKGKTVLAEGAQGSMLDVDFGTYPYVTSSNTTIAGVCSGLGIAPQYINEVFGTAKVYTTRVGSGHFPTELLNGTGDLLQQLGNEVGATTGRKRRCGWLDLPVLRYTCMINGVSQLSLMKLDVLQGLGHVQVCDYYERNGEKYYTYPFDCDESYIPHYVYFDIWAAGSEPDENLIKFTDYIRQEVKVRIGMLSIGADRNETYFL